MREIKFRALLKADGRIYEVRSVDFLNKEATLWDKETAVNFEASFKDIELLQFAGFKDKNSVEIYTGYIVRWDLLIYEICFDCGFYMRDLSKDGRFVITRLCDKGVNYGALLGFNWWYPDDLFEISSEEASHLKVAGVKYDC